MNQKKDEEIKKLQIRLPNDEYVRLKYLAGHHGNSLNAEVLDAINMAELKARETGLYIPVTELSFKGARDSLASPFEEMRNTYFPPLGFGQSPVEIVRDTLDDWLLENAKLRLDIFQLLLAVESIDGIIRHLMDPDNAFLLKQSAEEDKSGITTAVENANGLPALRKTYQSYLELTGNAMQKMKKVEDIQKSLREAIIFMHKISASNASKDHP